MCMFLTVCFIASMETMTFDYSLEAPAFRNSAYFQFASSLKFSISVFRYRNKSNGDDFIVLKYLPHLQFFGFNICHDLKKQPATKATVAYTPCPVCFSGAV